MYAWWSQVHQEKKKLRRKEMYLYTVVYLSVKYVPESREELGRDCRWGSTFAVNQGWALGQVINCSELQLPHL